MKATRSILRALSIASFCTAGLNTAYAQATNSGDIRGTVTDATGALVPDVTVTVMNLNTGVTKVLTTNKAGLFDTSSIVVGTYSVTFEKEGFARFERSSVSIQVGATTINAALKIGATTQEVVVNTDVPLLQTESGEQSTTFDARSMQTLPNVGQDWQNFAILIPGSSGTNGNQGTTNPGQQISANGNLPYSNVLSDGATTTLGTSQNSDVNTLRRSPKFKSRRQRFRHNTALVASSLTRSPKAAQASSTARLMTTFRVANSMREATSSTM